MKTILWQDADAAQRKKALARPRQSDESALKEAVSSILRDVRERGDDALRELSLKFDHVALQDFRVPASEITAATQAIEPKLFAALEQAKANIAAFHELERPNSAQIETMPGVTCALHWRAIDTVGLYIPGGTAPLFSTVLMQAIPARLAGCRHIILCTPPQKDGKIHPAILAAAHMCELTEIYALGGAQAIAAMAYGTVAVPKVDKIFGPGNAYVTLAKQIAAQDPEGAAIDLPAGPSEVMVIAEDSANPIWVAADLLAQAEHDASAQAIFVTTSEAFAKQVETEVSKQLAVLSRRAIAEQSLAESRIIVVPDTAVAIEVANLYAPEHLIIHSEDAANWLPEIRQAGSVFLGAWTPESAGDYASGTNHVLPTYGYARAYGGLTVLSFMKSMTVQSMTRDGLRRLGPTITTMAEAEGLDAHAHTVRVRLMEDI